jgi:hypothetical protein
VIKTDRPRFKTITVEDDGIGMTPATLAHLLHHIGGSAKRSVEGIELGIANPTSPNLSPSGRRLIGKIGIGLFSVAQLTHRFQIVTKTEGDAWRTIASVALKQYSDDAPPPADEHGEYEAGLVRIWRERATDLEAHGTTIVLTDLRPQARDSLRSLDLWAAVDSDQSLGPEESRDLLPPTFHIGRVGADPDDLVGEPGDFTSLPWTSDDSPRSAFRKLVDAVWSQVDQGRPNPKLETLFDYYLRMVWQLSLAIPTAYVEGDPFSLDLSEEMSVYSIPPRSRDPLAPVALRKDQSILDATAIGVAAETGQDFVVLFDDLELARPLKFVGLPATNHAVKQPILFVGRCREEFTDIPSELTGGPLEFDAYLMWAPKIVPTEHQGSLVRIHGSSGTLFDPTFMRYQVSEQTRLRQISCEIFVSVGLEAALNIDRESFNYAHPHVVYITKWLHAALRRVATVQKRIASDLRGVGREEEAVAEEQLLQGLAAEAWRQETDDPGAVPPPVFFEAGGATDNDVPGAYRIPRETIFGTGSRGRSRSEGATERKMRAIVQLLAAFSLLDDLSASTRDRLLAGLRKIIESTDE